MLQDINFFKEVCDLEFMDETKRREISVGFVRPKNLEGDTIYVQVGRRPGLDYAEAVSLEKFDYLITDDQMTIPVSGTETGFNFYNLGFGYFLNMLKEKNNIETIRERYYEDGLELSRRLNQIQTLSNLRYPFQSNNL